MPSRCVIVVGFPPLSAETFRGRAPQDARWLLSSSLEGFAFVAAARSAEALHRTLDPRGECLAEIAYLEGCHAEALSLSPLPKVALYVLSDFVRDCLVGRQKGRKERKGKRGRSKARLLSEAVYAGAQGRTRGAAALSGWRIAR